LPPVGPVGPPVPPETDAETVAVIVVSGPPETLAETVAVISVSGPPETEAVTVAVIALEEELGFHVSQRTEPSVTGFVEMRAGCV
jgi:hypothetical protein